LKISFIAHSLGGVIVRRALDEPLLAPLLPHLHALVTLAAPHLGTLLPDSQLVSAGMRALWAYKHSPALQQLHLEDVPASNASSPLSHHSHSMQRSLLYRLATSPSPPLKRFRHVVLVASLKDQYVPQYSATLTVPAKVARDAIIGPHISFMVDCLAAQLSGPEALVRIVLENNYEEGALNVDNLIGRAAHISFLEHSHTAAFLTYTLSPFLS
jgi:hypothetical protein